LKTENCNFLFVYGTLRKDVDHPMSDILQKYKTNTVSGTFNGKLFDVGSYPAAIISDDPSSQVHGELYTLREPDALFQHLDHYEGFDVHSPSKSLYLRKQVTITTEKAAELSAWTYLYNRSVELLTPIPGGDYLAYLKSK